MDTFFEQIVSIKKSGVQILAILGIWILALIVCAVIFLIVPLEFIGLMALLIFGIIYGAFKLSAIFNVEYEYIITNGTLDIDKITNKSSRKRILSLELNNTSRLEKYSDSLLNSLNQKDITFACNKNDENAYLLVAQRDGKPAAYLIFAPSEKLQGATVKFVPKHISNSAFK